NKGETKIPVYDKSLQSGYGDRVARDLWPVAKAPVDVVLLEGWCFGFRALDRAEFAQYLKGVRGDSPVLKYSRQYTDQNLSDINEGFRVLGAQLYDLIDTWVWMRVGDIDVVYRWRKEQEDEMGAQGKPTLDDQKLEDFVARFMPAYELAMAKLDRYGFVASGKVQNHTLRLHLDADRNVVAHDHQIIAKNSSAKQRRKKKSRKDKLAEEEARTNRLAELIASPQNAAQDVKVEYVEAKEPALENPEFSEYSSVFSLFTQNAERSFGAHHESPNTEDAETKPEPTAMDTDSEKTDSDAEMSDVEKTKVSRKQRKQQQMTVAELKQKAPRPEVVEWTDVSAKDPLLLVTLKATRNTVPVPSHWSQKKKYLQYKRGQEKPQFELPDFIKATGIMEMRETATEDVKAKTAARERMRPKMNKLTLDYQRLHDAFFKFQTKPANMTGHGDLYYEGKENETTLGDQFTPGVVSQQLRDALGVPPLAPMPWLLNMQRHGMPPSYPNIKVPGLNAPIPKGAQWGFHPGGWGRPPVDEYGRPLYGNVFAEAVDGDNASTQIVPTPGSRKHWGDLEVLESSDEEDEEDEEEESDSEEDAAEEQEEARIAEESEPTDEQQRSGIATIPSG
ncbi:hypothetical protein LPJ73_005606, partial [Coemansia sp. RSA 2703]